MSLFHTEHDAIHWYEGQERVLTKDFIDAIPWAEVKKHPIDPQFIPVLIYMRDVERFTDMYYRELRLTPTGRDPIVRRFMEKWSTEEITHADLLNRFLGEIGIPTEDGWYEKVKRQVPFKYRITSRINSIVSNCFGRHFSAVHMTWGAINELTTLNGYRRLWQLAKHPVLEHILHGIAREEASHSFFYWSLAHIKLAQSRYRQELTKYIVKKFWTPVGQGAKRWPETNYVIKTLFSGTEGVSFMDTHVNKRIEQLPGLAGLKFVTNTIARVAI